MTKSEKIVFLKDNLDDIFMTFDMNFTDKGKDILKKLARDERMINYDNLLFKTGDPIIANYDFLKRFGTLHNLLIDLLNEKISTLKVVKGQNEMIKNMSELG